MTIYEETIAKISQLPESIVSEINDLIDFLLLKQDRQEHFSESLELAESDLLDYLPNLESYEDKLIRGEIQW